MAVRNNAQSKEADQFLESLIRGDDPKFEPRESAQWAKTFLDSIRRYRAKDEFLNDPEVVGSAERLGRTAAADPYRFFWEFWQNADDAGATKVVFSIDENELVITNNGRSFTSREIHSLLFVASSTKSINPELMGQFGVGSLSLMRLSQNPKYESGNYAFRMGHSYTYPESLDANQAKPYPGTRITAPLVSDIDRDKLIKDLSDRIQNETLMYMKNLTKVVVRDVRNGEDIEAVIRTRRTGDGHSITIGDNRWLRFVRTVVPPHGILRDDGTAVRGPVTITVAREPIGGERHPVCAYFPTQQYHNYPWRFSAPFDVTTGRESLIQSDFNRWLLAEVGRTMVKAAVAKGVGKPSEPWDVVPLERHQDDLLNNVWLGAREAMKDIAWLPTETANVTPDEAVFAETADVLRLVSSADLKNIGEGGRTWVKSIPSDKARPVLKDLGALRVCCHIISRVLEKGPVNRNSEWYLNTLATAIQMSAEIGGENENEIEGRLIEGECILQMGSRKEPGKLISLMAAGRDDRVVCNARSERLATELGSLFPEGLVTSLHRVYRLPDKATDDTDDDKRRVVDQWLRQKSSERTFRYVTRLDPASFIKMFVAERPAPENPEVVSDGLLMFVRRHISSYINDQPERRRSQSNLNLGRALLVEAHCLNSSGVEISGYKPVSEVHIPTDYFTRPTWAKAAEGIPDIWWLNPRYRSELVLQDKKNLSPRDKRDRVREFLEDLGAHIGPRIEPIESDASHNRIQFTSITRGDHARYPNFPHDDIPYGSYSEYGLVGDSRSSDITKWLRYVSGLGLTDRSTHGEALLRALEDQSESYLAHSTASAKGYYSNGEYSLGEVPSRWVYEMRQEEWVSSSERFGKLEDTYAKTEETVALIDPAVDLLCDWDCRSVEVAHALGFKTDVSATKVISDLRRAKSAETASNLVRFSAYYEYLGKTDIGQSEAKDAFGDGLIFAPSRRQRWCRPEECLQKDQTSVFGEFCGYLNMYEEALPLWESLEVMATPDMEFLIRFWNRTAAEVKSQVEGMQRVLRNTYDLAEKLLEGSNIARQPIQVVAGEDWREGSLVFATSSDEIAEQLTSHGLLRWDYQFPERVPRFLRWAGIPYVERDADIQVVPSNVVADTDLERKLHVGVQVFATEIDRQAPDILPAIRSRIRDILHGKVKRLDGLTVQISLNIASGDNIDCTVAVSAFYKEGNVFISGSTAISDESLATELLKGLNLSGHQQTSAINILRLQLMSDHSDADLEPLDLLDEEDLPDLGVEYLDTPPSTDREDPLDDDPIEPEGGEFGRKRRSEPVVHPTDGFQVASDIGGENSDQHEGGLQSSPETKLREPSPKGRHDRGGSGPDKHSRRDTEQRAVDLFRQYVLEPEGIDISDQTLVSRVGADLSCSDGVFRELKSYSESGGGRVKLTSHEYVRAEHAQMAYELVIVEHVWGNEPSITIIPNPLARLKYWPVGDIAAEGWNQMNPPPRVVRLEII